MKEKIKTLLIISITAILSVGTTATALLVTNASNITLDSDKTDKTNVKDALDEAYTNIGNIKRLIKNEDGNYKSPICIRATNLHTETCNSYCSAKGSIGNGNTITYGNKITTSGVLNTGDAFTCDVNDDGIYDEQTERFYYVSDYYDTINSSSENAIFDEETAVLVFYANTYRSGSAEVQIDNTKGKAYNTSNYNYQGPTGLKTYLPKTTEWKNVSLKELTRQIRSEYGKTKNADEKSLVKFSYSGYASRLLTTQEIRKGCENNNSPISTSSTSTCLFLLENTSFSISSNLNVYWLESVSGLIGESVKVVNYNGSINGVSANYTSAGVRPAIEVPKSQIAY